jgi:HK97 family phage major capsid protein
MPNKLRRNMTRGRQRDARRGDVRTLIEKRTEVGSQIIKLREVLHDRRAKSKDDPSVVPEFTAEEEATWSKINKEFNRLDAELDTAQRARKVQAKLDAVDPDDYEIGRDDVDAQRSRKSRKERHANHMTREQAQLTALQGWFRSMMGKALRAEHVQACQQLGVNPRGRHFDLRLSGTQNIKRLQEISQMPRHQRALTSDGTAANGGALVGQTFVNNLELAMLDYSGIMQAADIIDTETGEPLVWPTGDDTTNKGAIIGENGSVGTETKPTFGQQVWGAYKFTSKPLLLTQEIIEDSPINLVGMVPGCSANASAAFSTTTARRATGLTSRPASSPTARRASRPPLRPRSPPRKSSTSFSRLTRRSAVRAVRS